jgi:hypothetical protein
MVYSAKTKETCGDKATDFAGFVEVDSVIAAHVER